MKRFLLAALFFAVLLMIWEHAVSCKDLVACPPALAPASGSLPGRRCGGWNSGKGDDCYDASIAHRLHHWTCSRAAVGIVDRALEGVARHHWNASPGSPDIAECLLGPACVVVVRTDGSRYAFRGSNGHALVGSDRHGNWRAQRAANLRRAALTMGSKRLHMWFKVILPAALPFIVSGMKQGWAFAWRSLMAAEIFVTILTGFGLGQLLHYGRELNAMEQVIGIMIVIVVIGLLADKIFFSPIERFLHRRWGTSQA